MLKNQLFGVEVEMTGITREKAAAIVAEVLGTMPSQPNSTCYETRIIFDQANRKWKVMRDGSINPTRNDNSCNSLDEYKVEFVTPPLGYTGGINHEHYNKTRYHGVNLHSYFSKGTVEFRLFNSTLHAGKIKAYVQFCLAVSAWAITSQEKIVFRSMDGYTPEKKVTIMRSILTHRLGLYGDEFKTCRFHLMNPLKKSAGMTCRAA